MRNVASVTELKLTSLAIYPQFSVDGAWLTNQKSNLNSDLEVDAGLVGDDLTVTADELHAAKQAEAESLPDPEKGSRIG